MRITVDIDAPVLKLLCEEAQRSGVSFEDVLNHTLCLGLERREPGEPEPYVCPTFPMGTPRVPVDAALALSNELEDEEIARQLDLLK